MRFLEEFAAKEGCSLYTALRRNLEDPLFKGTKGAQFVKLVEEFSASCAERPISELLSDLMNRSGYETMLRTEGSQERLDNLAELKQSIYEYETTCGEEATLEHYLAHVALFTNSDADDHADKVKLMTVHAAKGLEFPYVFLCGMNEGIFPSRKVRTLPAMEEERRLAFVAVTRAEQRLYLSEAEGRGIDGAPRYLSRFLLDIGEEHLEQDPKPRPGLIEDAKSYIAMKEKHLPESLPQGEFTVGQRVRHSILGPGTVIAVDTEKGAHVIQFDGIKTARSISFKVKLAAEQT